MPPGGAMALVARRTNVGGRQTARQRWGRAIRLSSVNGTSLSSRSWAAGANIGASR
ncbi:MAG: hypothetical protein U0531_03465 [Dehalococcoidia bacterium]